MDFRDWFVGKQEMFMKDGLHLSGKGDAVIADGLKGEVGSRFGNVRYLNYFGRGLSEKTIICTGG